MISSNAMKVKRNDNAIWRVIDGEVVIMSSEETMLHALTGCGSQVWALIDGETTVSEIIQRICSEYEVEPQKAREEITEFILESIFKIGELTEIEIEIHITHSEKARMSFFFRRTLWAGVFQCLQ